MFFGSLTSASPVAPGLLASTLFWSYGTVMDYVTRLTAIKTPGLPDPTLPLSGGEANPAKLHGFQRIRSTGQGGRKLQKKAVKPMPGPVE